MHNSNHVKNFMDMYLSSLIYDEHTCIQLTVVKGSDGSPENNMQCKQKSYGSLVQMYNNSDPVPGSTAPVPAVRPPQLRDIHGIPVYNLTQLYWKHNQYGTVIIMT